MTAETSDNQQESRPRRVRRQTLGRRVGLNPYYTIAEQHGEPTTRLVLQSQTAENQRVGRRYMIGSLAIGALTPLTILVLYLVGSQSVGDTCFGAALSWPAAMVGILGFQAGRAIASTRNSITVDAEAQTMQYAQENQVHRPRSQTLHFDQIARLHLHPREVKQGRLLARRLSVWVLEVVTDEEYSWIVDSARDKAALQPLATALTGVAGWPAPLAVTPAAQAPG